MPANPITSIYFDPPKLPSGEDRIAVLSTELETVDRLIVMGYLYCNNVQLVLRKNLLENEIEMLENARNKHPRPNRLGLPEVVEGRVDLIQTFLLLGGR